MKEKLVWSVFWALVGVFIVIAGVFSIPALRDLIKGFPFIITSVAILLLLGVALIVLTIREKVGGVLKKFFLILTGASSAGFFVSVLLHNAIYGLFIHFFGADFWNGGDEPVFFIMAIFVCPLGFLAGTIGSIVLAIRESRQQSEPAGQATTGESDTQP